MKKFEPSCDFVSKVMEDVYLYQKRREAKLQFSRRLLSSKPLRYAISAGGVLLGVLNIIRFYYFILAPVVCR